MQGWLSVTLIYNTKSSLSVDYFFIAKLYFQTSPKTPLLPKALISFSLSPSLIVYKNYVYLSLIHRLQYFDKNKFLNSYQTKLFIFYKY